MTRPISTPETASSRSSSGNEAITSPSRSIAGLPASWPITFASALVIVISGPTGPAPCETQGSTSAPRSRTATAPSVWTSPSRMSIAPPANEALARPPSTGMCGRLPSRAASSSSAGKLNGSQRAMMDSSIPPSSSAGSVRDSGSPSSRKPSASRSAVTCIVWSTAPGSEAPQTTTPGVSSSSRPAATVPPAPHPISAFGSSRSCTSERSHFAMPRC